MATRHVNVLELFIIRVLISVCGLQKNVPQSQRDQGERFKEGKENSHKALDSKDERSIANKLAREEHRQKEPEPKDFEKVQLEQDARLPVC